MTFKTQTKKYVKAQNECMDEENYSEKKRLTELIFEKARNESKEVAKTALANYIDENSSLKFKTSTRMYDRYILGNSQKSIPTMFNLNLAAKFIEYESFGDFCHQNFPEENKNTSKKEVLIPVRENENNSAISSGQSNFVQGAPKKKNYLKSGIAGLGLATIVGLGSYIGVTDGKSNECMYWDETKYAEIKCDEEIHPETAIIPYDEQIFNYFYKIEPTDTTTFFRAGIPIVWYVKIDGKPEFYSADGKHPINGKELKKVTPYIINKYVLNK